MVDDRKGQVGFNKIGLTINSIPIIFDDDNSSRCYILRLTDSQIRYLKSVGIEVIMINDETLRTP